MDQPKEPIKQNEDYINALDKLGLEFSDVESNSLISIKSDTKLSDRVTKVNDISTNYKMTLEGKSMNEEKGGYHQTTKALASKRFIDLSFGLLSNYASSSNLMTTKEQEAFYKQAWDSWIKVNRSLVLRDRAIPERNSRLVLKLFKDALINVGEILLGSKRNIDKVFDSYKEQEDNFPNPMGKI